MPLILKCERTDCEGHLIGFTADGKPLALPNKSHSFEGNFTKEAIEQILTERLSEPFATFMDVLQEVKKA